VDTTHQHTNTLTCNDISDDRLRQQSTSATIDNKSPTTATSDNEIQVIPPNSHPTTVYTKLSYDWREETGVDKAQW
jgi:hypothetical protein